MGHVINNVICVALIAAAAAALLAGVLNFLRGAFTRQHVNPPLESGRGYTVTFDPARMPGEWD